MEAKTEEALGRLLEAIRDAPLGSDSVPDVPEIDRAESMRLVEELLKRGWVDAQYLNRGDGSLVSVWEPRITRAGEAALEKLRVASLQGRTSGPLGTARTLEEKRRMRLELMHGLYEATDGSTSASVAARELGNELGWDAADTDQVVEYLAGEGLLELVAFGPQVSITHRGVVEVEEALHNPNRPTKHFAPINIINVGSMYGSQIQQGNVQSEQALVLPSEKRIEIADLVVQLRGVLGDLELSEEDRSELEAELDTAHRQLQSSRPKAPAIRDSLRRAGEILVTTSTVAGSGVRLVELISKLHRVLPGI